MSLLRSLIEFQLDKADWADRLAGAIRRDLHGEGPPYLSEELKEYEKFRFGED